jgi:hypothetical protein
MRRTLSALLLGTAILAGTTTGAAAQWVYPDYAWAWPGSSGSSYTVVTGMGSYTVTTGTRSSHDWSWPTRAYGTGYAYNLSGDHPISWGWPWYGPCPARGWYAPQSYGC